MKKPKRKGVHSKYLSQSENEANFTKVLLSPHYLLSELSLSSQELPPKYLKTKEGENFALNQVWSLGQYLALNILTSE